MDQIKIIVDHYRMMLYLIFILGEGRGMNRIFIGSLLNRVWHIHAYGDDYLKKLSDLQFSNDYLEFAKLMYGRVPEPQPLFDPASDVRIFETERLFMKYFSVKPDSLEKEVELNAKNNRIIPL
jgi:hypothetical protein